MEYFTNEVCEQIGYYVYRLIYPRNGETFYGGKGNTDECNKYEFHFVCKE